MRPQHLPPNVLRHFYAGGARIAALRGLELESDHMPEEWIGAINTTFGATDGRGLAALADGTLVRDAIAADPEGWLGAEHVVRYGRDAALLTKLLDAGERLPVHFHPGLDFAGPHLQMHHGKTEAWLILEADPGATVHVGFSRPLEPDELRAWIEAQDGEPMLAAMNEVGVAAGDSIFVPAGTVHSIGAGVFLLELQEPTDLSVSLEHEPFGLTTEEATLGLGWDAALPALDTSAWDTARIASVLGTGQGTTAPQGARLLPEAADPFFRAERVRGGEALDAGFSVLVALAGQGALRTRDGGGLDLTRGSAAIVPHAAGPATLDGDIELLRCRPPAPDAPAGAAQ